MAGGRRRRSDALAARREQKLRNWIRREGKRDAEASPVLFRAACADAYLDRLRAALERPDLLRELPIRVRDRFVVNAGYDIEWVMWSTPDASESLLRVLAAVPAALEGAFAGEPREQAGGMYMFWDGVTGMAEDRPYIRQVIFDALVVQLRSGDRSCQESALHGFNHLQDVRCRPIIEAFQRTCRDPEMVAYAEASKNFGTA